ncbi:n-acetylgalactosamine-6-sulfatase [Trichonephila clavata]|uniref:N-acetylgalactosamine-6-sulfatase n=1 Tax=Trichonephila clavata TaxID=2740835 RepID=A0A8X6FIS8_TRICU|nr:n-acetylgalactosamine-6-sulfatase [Trichonephila clavata]
MLLRKIIINQCSWTNIFPRITNSQWSCVCATLREACQKLNLLENDAHWDISLADASNIAQPKQIRTLFSITLTTCFPANRKDLWGKYKDYTSENILHRMRRINANPNIQFTSNIYSEALILIEDVSYQPSTVMDLFSIALGLASVEPPKDRIIDGIDLLPSWVQGKKIDRPIFYYRGNELMAARYGLYKAHFWCWTNSYEEFNQGIDYCPGMDLKGMTSHEQLNHTSQPILFHLGRDPGEKYQLNSQSNEYRNALQSIIAQVNDHRSTLVPGKPQLNMCDRAVMHWSPPGCEKLDDCLKPPPSTPYKCDWPH